MRTPAVRRQRGYTLIEALVAIAIIGMISLVAVPNFMTYYRAGRLKSSLRQFTSDLRQARQIAVSEQGCAMISYKFGTQDVETSTYTIYAGDYEAGACSNWEATMPMSQAEAAKYIKDVANATKTAASSPMVKALTTAASVQRNILSDMWLNLRPTHWIRNAMSAQAALMMDDIYSIDRMDDMVKYLAPKFAGSSANVRIGRAFDPLWREKPRNWTRNIWDSEANLYAKLMEAGSGMWTGYKSLGGRVPFGEEAFYTRGYTQAFKNLFRPLWSDIVDSTMMPTIKELGVDDETARRAREVLINTGLNGSKGDVAETCIQ